MNLRLNIEKIFHKENVHKNQHTFVKKKIVKNCHSKKIFFSFLSKKIREYFNPFLLEIF